MKKLLLVLALPLMLVGCSNQPKEPKWTTLEPNQQLTVYFAETEQNFSYRNYSLITYRATENDGLLTLKIKTVYLTINQNFEYKGNISYCISTQV